MPCTNRYFSSVESYSVNNNGTAIASFPVGNPPKQKLKMVDDKNRFSSIGENKGSGKTKSPQKKKKKNRRKKKGSTVYQYGDTGICSQVVQPKNLCNRQLTGIDLDLGTFTTSPAVTVDQEETMDPSMNKRKRDYIITNTRKTKKTKKEYQCGFCKEYGHSRDRCPNFFSQGQGTVKDSNQSRVEQSYSIYHVSAIDPPEFLTKSSLEFLNVPPAPDLIPCSKLPQTQPQPQPQPQLYLFGFKRPTKYTLQVCFNTQQLKYLKKAFDVQGWVVPARLLAIN